MKLLWFKQIYVNPILCGDKTDTIRLSNNRLREGDVVSFSVGPRPPFAKARILQRENVSLSTINTERQAQLSQHYDDLNLQLVRLKFKLIS